MINGQFAALNITQKLSSDVEVSLGTNKKCVIDLV